MSDPHLLFAWFGHFSRLKRKKGIKNPLKYFRRISATLLTSNKHYRGLDVLFLGHAPATIEERHYTQAACSACTCSSGKMAPVLSLAEPVAADSSDHGEIGIYHSRQTTGGFKSGF